MGLGITYSLSIVTLVLLSGFFAAAETAITGISQATLHKLASMGNKRAQMVSKLRHDKERLISTLLLGNSACNTFASALATTLFIDFLGNKDSTILYATICMTIVIFVLAEVLPKTYAFEHPEKFAFFCAPIVTVLLKLLYPFTTTIQVIINRILSFGRKTSHPPVPLLSGKEELRGAIELHHHKGKVFKSDVDMLASILDLTEMEIGEIMVHRKQMFTLNIDLPMNEIIDQALNSRHTRIPFWQHDADNVIGILNTRDLVKILRHTDNHLDTSDIKNILSLPWFVPENTSLKEQMNNFRKRRNHLALVINEYGSLLGLVTLEDILEEIVGQIEDEYDHVFEGIQLQPDSSYIIEATTTIRDINRELQWSLPDQHASTLVGLIMHETEKVPEEGEVVELHGMRFTILTKVDNHINTIKVEELNS